MGKSSTHTPVIELVHLSKFYGNSRGVENVSLKVSEGEIFGFLGPNGAGKSTTINLLLDIIRPSSGHINMFGMRLSGDSKASSLRQKIGYLSGEIELYENMSGRAYIRFVGALSGGVSNEKVQQLSDRLHANLDKKIKDLSRGNRQKIGLIAVFARNTKLLILDEPTSGLDPLIQQQFNELVKEYRDAGGTVFISSHILSEVESLCDRVAFVKDGTLIAEGTLSELIGSVAKKVSVNAPATVLGSISRLPNVRSFTATGGSATFEITGNPAKVLASMPLSRLHDITVENPEIEELFMGYYESSKTKADR